MDKKGNIERGHRLAKLWMRDDLPGFVIGSLLSLLLAVLFWLIVFGLVMLTADLGRWPYALALSAAIVMLCRSVYNITFSLVVMYRAVRQARAFRAIEHFEDTIGREMRVTVDKEPNEDGEYTIREIEVKDKE